MLPFPRPHMTYFCTVLVKALESRYVCPSAVPQWAKFSPTSPPRRRRGIPTSIKHSVSWAPGVFTQTESLSLQPHLHSVAELCRVIDWQTDTAIIANNSLHLMHSMQPKNKGSEDIWYSASLWRNFITEALKYGTHTFTCHPRVFSRMKWTNLHYY